MGVLAHNIVITSGMRLRLSVSVTVYPDLTRYPKTLQAMAARSVVSYTLYLTSCCLDAAWLSKRLAIYLLALRRRRVCALGLLPGPPSPLALRAGTRSLHNLGR